uniref:Uncharacterized protein n=1 Tax=Romanomermis culicivorax TaxID=13658 RepID=A0A915IE01_ROMCU
MIEQISELKESILLFDQERDMDWILPVKMHNSPGLQLRPEVSTTRALAEKNEMKKLFVHPSPNLV